MKIKIAHVYPELLNLYGDMGNIASLKKRAQWRNIEVDVVEYNINDIIDFENTDILFIGGGSDKEQLTLCNKLKEYTEEIKKYIENNGVIMAICSGFEILGKYYKVNNKEVQALGLLEVEEAHQLGKM